MGGDGLVATLPCFRKTRAAGNPHSSGSIRGYCFFDQSLRYFLSPDDFANAFGQHELDLAVPDFLVELHGGKKLGTLTGDQPHIYRESGSFEKIGNAGKLGVRQPRDLARQSGGSNLSERNSLPVEIL